MVHKELITDDSGENGDPFNFSKLEEGETGEEKEFVITPDTKIDEIETNVIEYLKNDLSLNSNLLIYVLKKKTPEELESIFNTPEVDELGEDCISEVKERIENLEVLEKEHFTFLVPIDKWEDGKIELPKNEEADYIAPSDLTAILKQPVIYNYSKETDGRNSDTDDYVVFDEEWVGKEIRHFPWSKELLRTAEEIKEKFGYHLPKSWKPIVEGLREQLNKEGKDGSDNKQVSTALRERLRLALSGGCVWGDLANVGESGTFWSASGRSASYAEFLNIFSSGVFSPVDFGDRDTGLSVRLVRSKNDKE